MADNKIAIKIMPPSRPENISEDNLVRFSQIVKIPVDRIKARISAIEKHHYSYKRPSAIV